MKKRTKVIFCFDAYFKIVKLTNIIDLPKMLIDSENQYQSKDCIIFALSNLSSLLFVLSVDTLFLAIKLLGAGKHRLWSV